MFRGFFVISPFSNDFFHFPLIELWLQKAAGYRRLLKSLFPPMKRLMLHLIFVSFILPQTPAALVRCSGSWWMGTSALSSPKPRSKNSWSGSAAAAMPFITPTPRGSVPWGCVLWGPHGWLRPLLFSLHTPVLAEFCPEKHRGSDVPWALLTLWIAQFSQNLPASSSW